MNLSKPYWMDILNMQQTLNIERYVNPDDIAVPIGYQIEVFAQGIDTPIGIDFTERGDLLIADSGILSGNPKVLLLSNGQFSTLAEGFNVPITGITYRNGSIYVAHRGVISIVQLDGSIQNIIYGLPSQGDFSNNKVSFGPDEKMYFGQGTATNSGVVGLDNEWVFEHHFFSDRPGSYVMLNGQNFETQNMLIPVGTDIAYTGAFSAYAVANLQRFELIKRAIRASGSILRANPDGTELEQVTWGFRNPFNIQFDTFGRGFISNQGYDNRGSRPITNAPDELHILIPETWYGWPDYSAGELVTLPKYAPANGPDPELLFTNHPSVPPRPFAVFPPNSNIMGFDFNINSSFGELGDIYIATFGIVRSNLPEVITTRPGVGHSIIKVDMDNGQLFTFVYNKSGLAATREEGGLGRPTDVKFGPDGEMYISDFSMTTEEDFYSYYPNTGVIWRVSRI
ncbi:hypothetical protein I5677_13630 [Mobilitalea sibirica]|uniref:Glucose/Sorbosone dehydrogenase domain-containing protein n=1 Tax=Mobilitalea sibirica TaxID=1462919 RepID=A0A8J7H3W6_9FIRM|nr:hypothetical protein [Mobilitalea sibirica]MBH1941938.1 hypothetical protein [Mobilitalea sibirica]